MNTDNILSYLFETKAAAAAEGIDRDFDELINQVDHFIYAIQTARKGM